MNKELLKTSLDAIRDILDIKIDPNNPQEVAQKLSDLNAIQGLSAECYARSEALASENLKRAVDTYKNEDFTATEKKYLYGAFCNEFNYLYNISEKYNKEVHYQIESMRTFISNLKEQYKAHL